MMRSTAALNCFTASLPENTYRWTFDHVHETLDGCRERLRQKLDLVGWGSLTYISHVDCSLRDNPSNEMILISAARRECHLATGH
jgi:hypothetical protein